MDADDNAVRRRPVPPRTHCPPSRRGHAWRELGPGDLALHGATPDRLALRVCKGCGKLGRVTSQGVIKVVT